VKREAYETHRVSTSLGVSLVFSAVSCDSWIVHVRFRPDTIHESHETALKGPVHHALNHAGDLPLSGTVSGKRFGPHLLLPFAPLKGTSRRRSSRSGIATIRSLEGRLDEPAKRCGSIKPGVERSGTPGTSGQKDNSPRSGRQPWIRQAFRPLPRADDIFSGI